MRGIDWLCFRSSLIVELRIAILPVLLSAATPSSGLLQNAFALTTRPTTMTWLRSSLYYHGHFWSRYIVWQWQKKGVGHTKESGTKESIAVCALTCINGAGWSLFALTEFRETKVQPT